MKPKKNISRAIELNPLKVTLGDKLNALFGAAEMNFRKHLGFILAH